MQYKKVQRRLSDYLSGRFTGKKKRDITSHLSECGKCAEQLRLMENMRELLRTAQPEESDETYWEGFLPRLKDRIFKAAVLRGEPANRRKPELLWAFVAIAVFGVILIVLTALNTEVRFEKNALSVKISFGSREIPDALSQEGKKMIQAEVARLMQDYEARRKVEVPFSSKGIPDNLSQEQKKMIQAEVAGLMQDYEARRKAEMALLLKGIQAQREADLTLINSKMEAIIRRTGEGFNNMSAALTFLTNAANR
jgi:hypothetical protein